MTSSAHSAYRQPTKADEMRAASAEIELTNHRVVRDGSVWSCRHCRAAWPFPGAVPADAGPCVPRRWGDEA